MIKCKLMIDRIVFPKNGKVNSGDFAILRAKVIQEIEADEELIKNEKFNTVSIKGIVPSLTEGDEYIFVLNNPETNNFGTTYNIKNVSLDFNLDNQEEVEKYLEIICGRSIAKELIKLDNPIELLKTRNSVELLKVKGIGESKLQKIFEKLVQLDDKSKAYIKLEPLGLSKKLINKICEVCGGVEGAIDVCFNAPYSLIRLVKGIGFLKADEIALNVGFSNQTIRLTYGVLHVLETNAEGGRSYLYLNQLMIELKKLIPFTNTELISVIQSLRINGEIIYSDDGNILALSKYLALELAIGMRIKELLLAESKVKVPDVWRNIISELEVNQGWCYNKEQLKGIETALKENVVVIRGLAGTGKTTIAKAVIEVLKGYEIDMCCLSAKASQRLSEVTGQDGKTIHRLLGLGVEKNDSISTERCIYSDIIIVDEASMIDGSLFLKLITAIQLGSKIIILGDTGQLTAIGNCNVFSDLIDSKVVPVVDLVEIHRQAKKSAIITESRKIREQIPICESNFNGKMILGELQDLELVIRNNSETLFYNTIESFSRGLQVCNDVMEVQIITPVKNRGILSSFSINNYVQMMYNRFNIFEGAKSFTGKDGVRIYKGDKVINLKNNYNTKDIDDRDCPIWNGSMGTVEDIQDEYCVINFSYLGKVKVNTNYLSNINLGYAISCHSSQGSQWKRVIFSLDLNAYKLLNVEMLYTGITRAGEHCTCICLDKAMKIATKTVEQKTKQTALAIYLHEDAKKIHL